MHFQNFLLVLELQAHRDSFKIRSELFSEAAGPRVRLGAAGMLSGLQSMLYPTLNSPPSFF